MILNCQNIEYTYTHQKILRKVSFHINKGEPTAIVGINGAGKTTLFKILTGQLTDYQGNLHINSDTSIGYLAQDNRLESDSTLYQELYQANTQIVALAEKIKQYETALNQKQPSSQLLNEYHATTEVFERCNGYRYPSDVKAVIAGLGFAEKDYSRPVNQFSGGEKTRIALGKILLQQPDLLLLDEPTNHLDLDTIAWLESYLAAYQGTLLLISHDRYFLDKLVTKIVDLENGVAKVYRGNYSTFIQQKEWNQEMESKHYDLEIQEIERQKKIIQQLRSFSCEKSIKRAKSREKILEKREVVAKPVHLRDNMHLHLDPKRASGTDVLKISDLGMTFGEKQLFHDFTLDIYKGDKIALIGKNGCGKTTLFKILLHQLKPSAGSFRYGKTVEPVYYDQEHSGLNDHNNLIQEISDEFPTLGESDIRNMLAAFLFTGDDVFKQIGDLSGGEKGRLALAKLMLAKGNFLLLDEPTNHLDMISKEVLEQALIHYSGTVFFISHDRYFINRVATKTVELTAQQSTLYLGNYDYYLDKKNDLATDDSDPDRIVDSVSAGKVDWQQEKQKQREERIKHSQIQKCEQQIMDLEQALETIDQQLEQEHVYLDYQKSKQLLAEKEDLEHQLQQLLENWEDLHQ